MGHMFFIVVHAHSKWTEVLCMNSTISLQMVDVLRDLFSKRGVPEQIVSDTGTQFRSKEFQLFVKRNGIEYVLSAAYHPTTEGLVESFIQTFKQTICAATMDKGSLQHKIVNYLLVYRNAVHTATNQT